MRRAYRSDIGRALLQRPALSFVPRGELQDLRQCSLLVPSKALRAVIGNLLSTNLRQFPARLVEAVADKQRGISKDLVEVLIVGSQPAVAGSAADEAVHSAEGTVAPYRLV